MAIQKLFKKIPNSTVEKAPGPGLLHPFPNQDWSMVRGALPIDRRGSLMAWWRWCLEVLFEWQFN